MPLTRRNDVFHRASITNIPIISIHAREPQRSSFRSCSSPSRLAALVATAAPPGKPGGLPSEYRGPSRRIHPDGPRSNPRSPATPLTILIHRRCRSESLPDPHVGFYCTETQIPSEAILKPSTPHFRRTLDRLGGLSPAADMALAYAVADWWDQGLDHTADGWSKAGVQVR